MELVKDGNPLYQWTGRHSGIYTTQRIRASEKDTGKYQCKGSIGAASRHSPSFYLIVGSKLKE
jgi:hypothetical protein